MISILNRLLTSVGASLAREPRPSYEVRRDYAAHIADLRRQPPDRFAAVVRTHASTWEIILPTTSTGSVPSPRNICGEFGIPANEG